MLQILPGRLKEDWGTCIDLSILEIKVTLIMSVCVRELINAELYLNNKTQDWLLEGSKHIFCCSSVPS